MVPNQPGRISFLCPLDNRALQNEPTSTADSAAEDMAGEADEPPDPILKSSMSTDSMASSGTSFRKSAYTTQKHLSLLTRILHTSESDSHVDEDDYAFYEPNRTLSSASTYSRSSAVSVAGLTSDDGLTSPHVSSPSPPIQVLQYAGTPPVFKQNSFQTRSTLPLPRLESIDPTHKGQSEDAAEEKLAAGLGRKRCITFFCGGKDAIKVELPKRADTMEEKKVEPAVRKSVLKFDCPLREGISSTSKSRPRMSSPPPSGHRVLASLKQIKSQPSSTSTVSAIPTAMHKHSALKLRHRDSFASDISQTEATRFHEFASSKEEDDDWTNEATCFQHPLTVNDTLEIENRLRKLAREVEEEDEDEDEDEDEEVTKKDDSDADEEEDEDEDEDENEDLDEDEEDEDEDDEIDRQSIGSGFQTDDELGFAHSDDESDGGSDYDWWAPGGATVRENIEVLRSAQRRRNSASSVESVNGAIPISPNLRRKSSRPLEIQRQPFDLPDSTDFVCGTLDEDKPLEQAFINQLAQRRAAKHKPVPQDIDPTFPTSDNEDEEDEVSERDETESDHPLMHGQLDLHEESDRHTRRLIPKKRSPLGSPRRLRSPPPAKRISLHRSPPPPARRARSPAPCALYRTRLSSSVPRKLSKVLIRQRQEYNALEDAAEDDQDNTPRFNRRAIDIVRGLEKKRHHRQQKELEKHCRKSAKSAKHHHKKHVQPGKGVERMRDVGIGLNEYRGIKCAESTPRQGDITEVHMLSY